ncbi:MAG: hypothetical protein ACYCVL_12370 [Gemmatimonadaceae bacterium]
MALDLEKIRYRTTRLPWSRAARLFVRTTLIAVTVAGPLRAQSPRGRAEVHAAVDMGFPSGGLGTHASAGLGGLIGVGIYSPANGIGLRVEGMYQALRTSARYITVCQVGQCNLQPYVGGANIDATLDIIGRSSVARTPKVYLLGGLGIYHTQALLPFATPGGIRDGMVSASGAGWNVGVGTGGPIAGTWCYVEARYYGVPVASDQRGGLVPISVGVRF